MSRDEALSSLAASCPARDKLRVMVRVPRSPGPAPDDASSTQQAERSPKAAIMSLSVCMGCTGLRLLDGKAEEAREAAAALAASAHAVSRPEPSQLLQVGLCCHALSRHIPSGRSRQALHLYVVGGLTTQCREVLVTAWQAVLCSHYIRAQARDRPPCRPRERIHRPQTRRRKENNEEAMDKMRAIQGNLTKARELVEQLLRRERKKRDIVVRCATGPLGGTQSCEVKRSVSE